MKDRAPGGAEKYAGIIRAGRKKKGLNQQQLAERIGVSRNTVAGWETGHSRPDLETLPRLCDSLGMSMNVFFGREEGVTGVERKMLDIFRALEENDRQVMMWQMEALLAQRALSRAGGAAEQKKGTGPRIRESGAAGSGRMGRRSRKPEPTPRGEALRRKALQLYRSDLSAAAGFSGTLEAERGEKVWIFADERTDKADEIIAVNGHSMEPTYYDGDLVLVQHTETLRPGEIGVFVVDGEGYIKEYQPDGLYSHNEAYAPMIFQDGNEVRCIGRVLGRIDDEQWPTEAQIEMLEEMRL